MSDDDYWTAPINTLGPLVPTVMLTDKSMRRPPFKFLHDIFHSLHQTYRCFPSVPDDKWSAEAIDGKDQKIDFLEAIKSETEAGLGTKIDVLTKKIVTGSECEKTAAFLLCVAGYALQCQSKSSAPPPPPETSEKAIASAAAAVSSSGKASEEDPVGQKDDADLEASKKDTKEKKEKKEKKDKKDKKDKKEKTKSGADTPNEESLVVKAGDDTNNDGAPPPPPPPPPTSSDAPATAPASEQKQQQSLSNDDDDKKDQSRPTTVPADDPVKKELKSRSEEFQTKVKKLGLSLDGPDLTTIKMAEAAIKMKQEIDASKKDVSAPTMTVQLSAEQIEAQIAKQLDLMKQVDQLIKGNSRLVDDIILYAAPA